VGVIALSLMKLLNPGDHLFGYRGEAQGKAALSRDLEMASKAMRSTWGGLPREIAGLLWHTITPAVDESIPLYTIGQYMNVQPTASPPYSLEEKWFRVLFDALARLWGHS